MFQGPFRYARRFLTYRNFPGSNSSNLIIILLLSWATTPDGATSVNAAILAPLNPGRVCPLDKPDAARFTCSQTAFADCLTYRHRSHTKLHRDFSRSRYHVRQFVRAEPAKIPCLYDLLVSKFDHKLLIISVKFMIKLTRRDLIIIRLSPFAVIV